MDRKGLQKFILGCDLECIHSKVLIAPCWSFESVGIENYKLISKSGCEIWECELAGEKFTYIVCGVGAAFCADVVMALQNTKCERILFLGSAGSLDSNINIGDIGVPNAVISGEGASRYLQEELEADMFGKSTSVTQKIHQTLVTVGKETAEKHGVKLFEGAGISVESIFSQYRHLEYFERLKCSYVDMEASAFLFAAEKANIERAIIFCISDNVKNEEPLYLVSEKRTEFRKKIRKKVMPQMIQAFLEDESRNEHIEV